MSAKIQTKLLTPKEIREIIERRSKATFGPWENHYGGRQTVHTKVSPSSVNGSNIKIADCIHEGNKHEDGDFIAASWDDIGRLIGHIRALEKGKGPGTDIEG